MISMLRALMMMMMIIIMMMVIDPPLQSVTEDPPVNVHDCSYQDTNLYDKSWLYSSSTAAISLYAGSKITVLDALVNQFHWFSQHPGVSKEALSSALAMQYKFLPTPNNLQSIYEAALSTIKPYLVQPIVYDVCKNDCVVFRLEYESLRECPKCGSATV